jgi:ATP-dependent 26S proteasome regulatory subunit
MSNEPATRVIAPPNSTATTASAQFLVEVETLLRANCPLLCLVTSEEKRVEALLASVAERVGKPVFSWSVTHGLHQGSDGGGPPVEGSDDPIGGLAAIAKLSEPVVVVLKDFHAYLDDPRVVRTLRELGQGLRRAGSTCVLLSPILVMPAELEKDVTVLDVPLPTLHELHVLLKDMVAELRKSNQVEVDLKKGEAELLVKAAMGLTLQEAENAFAKAIAHDRKIDAQDIQMVLAEKRQIIRKSGLLEYCPADDDLGAVGGLDNLKAWLRQRSAAFGEAARTYGLPEPKGLLLLGVQGCGKTLTSKAIAKEWKVPLLRLELGRILPGGLGAAEENLRRAIRVAESAAPAVLSIDEIDKALSGVADGGAVARVVGSLLTWLQDKTAPVFVVATANRLDALPPELLRKGRFDEIFFVDLPDPKERADVFAIHLRRRGRDPAKYDVAALAAYTDGFSGAEIEQAIIAAMYQSFSQQVEVSQDHIVQATRETYPLSKTLREEIQKLRTWAFERTRQASIKKR